MMGGKLVNADGGYGVVNTSRRYHWWNHYNFPLVPLLERRPADEWHAGSFHFTWLGLRVWSLSQLTIEASISLDEGGLRLACILPYLRVVLLLIPFPRKIMWFIQGLSRDVKVQRRNGHDS